jgi:hypothetical protein
MPLYLLSEKMREESSPHSYVLLVSGPIQYFSLSNVSVPHVPSFHNFILRPQEENGYRHPPGVEGS